MAVPASAEVAAPAGAVGTILSADSGPSPLDPNLAASVGLAGVVGAVDPILAASVDFAWTAGCFDSFVAAASLARTEHVGFVGSISAADSASSTL